MSSVRIAGLALLLLTAAWRTPAADPDVVIVGAGISGLAAAWELAQGGATVVVLDMSSVFGGHAVMATGDLCIIGTPFQKTHGSADSPDLAYKDFVTWGEDPNLDWVRYYVDHSSTEIYDWLTAMGVRFESLGMRAGNSVPRSHIAIGRGLGLVSPIYRQCLASTNITFTFNTRVDRLLMNGERVTGVSATNLRTGLSREIRARVVILATGGFQSNLDLVREFWPANLTFPTNLLIGSGINAVGSGLKIAQGAGGTVARLDHQWNYLTGLPDPRYPGTKRGLNASNADSIWVNTAGQRFMTERLTSKYGMPILLRQPGGTYWSIFDESAKRMFWVAGTGWDDFAQIDKLIFQNPALMKSAPTITELARKIGVPAGALRKTVRNYNAMVDAGTDTEFGRFGPSKDYRPKKIAAPPFYAAQFFPLTRKSLGGVVVDLGCRVQDAGAHSIPGLYAVGELTGLAGINGKAGLEGTFLGPCIVTGRVAGRTALAELGRPAVTGRVTELRADLPLRADPLATTKACLACHALPELVTQNRPGYWHFNKVHTAVLARKLDCGQCHAEISVVDLDDHHRINRVAQLQTCARCHQGEDH